MTAPYRRWAFGKRIIFPTGDTTLARTSWSGYDVFDRVVTSTDARGGTSGVSFNDPARSVTATDPYGATTTVGSDEAGNATQVTDAYGKSSAATYDLLGRVLTQIDATNRTTGFQYLVNADTNRVVAPGGAATDSKLDPFGRVGVATDPLGQVTSYDAARNRTTVADSKGGSQVSTYDAQERLVSRSLGDGATTAKAAAINVYELPFLRGARRRS